MAMWLLVILGVAIVGAGGVGRHRLALALLGAWLVVLILAVGFGVGVRR
jgi:hypothetical protein